MTTANKLLPIGRVALAAALLMAAGLMWSWLPTKLQSWAPIDVHGTVGQRVAGRNIAVTVHSTYLAREVTANGEHGLNRFPSTGVWLVMMVSYEPLLEPHSPRLELRADGRSVTTNLSGIGSRLTEPLMPARGPVAFELPAVPHSATLLVSNTLTDNNYQEILAPLDSRVAITIQLPRDAPKSSLNLSELSRQ